MKVNVGKTDRSIRVVLGLVVVALGLYYGSWWGAIGLVPLITGLFGSCPAYWLLGISTCPMQAKGA